MQLDKQFLDRQRRQGDAAADVLVADIFSKNKQAQMYALLKLEEHEIKKQPDSSIKEFLLSKRKMPQWFNSRRLKNGQRLFVQYASEMMALLGAMALPYCYASSPGNKALYLSDKMRNAPGKRLADTASFVIAVLTPGSLDDDKTGHISINRVRLIHALSRYYVKRLPQWNRSYGLPINQEDIGGTNLAFSYIILLGMQQSGFILSQKEKEDFLFAWRYIGYLLHINEKLLPSSFAEAAQLTGIIKKRTFKKTVEGITLASELLQFYKSTLPSWQAGLVQSQVRFYLGSEVCDFIGLHKDPIRDRITSSIGTFKSLQNMLTVKEGSYQLMLSQQTLMRKKLIRS